MAVIADLTKSYPADVQKRQDVRKARQAKAGKEKAMNPPPEAPATK